MTKGAGKISRSFAMQALMGFAWASAAQGQSADFDVAQDFLQAIPRAVGSLPDSDPKALSHIEPKALGEILQKFSAQTVKARSSAPQLKREDEDALLAEAERLLKDELLQHPGAKIPAVAKPLQPISGLAQESLIDLRQDGERLLIEPASLSLNQNGETSIRMNGLPVQPQVFLRDASKLSWDGERLKAMAPGKTEVYFVYKSEMYILPVQIGAVAAQELLADLGAQRLSSLPLPGSLASMGEAPRLPANADLSIADASLQAKRSIAQDEAQQKRFVVRGASQATRDTAVQVMDIRSDVNAGRIYPHTGVTVQLMGLNLQAKTDASGVARFADLPAGSRLWAVVADESGRIVPTASEIVVASEGKAQVQRVRTMSYENYVNTMNVFGVSQNWSLGSFCGRAQDSEGTQGIENLTVQLSDENAEGPFYFNDHGPNPNTGVTDRGGRFCFFNVKPGLTEVSFYQAGQLQTALTVPVFPGAHSDEDLPLGSGRAKHLYLASMGNAMDQLYGEDAAANRMESVSTANVISLGENDALVSQVDRVLTMTAQHSEFKGRSYNLVQTAEFENTISSNDGDSTKRSLPVLPLLQRGFVEDVFNELNQNGSNTSIAFDAALGQVFVVHELAAGEDPGKLQVTLTDAYGRTLDQGWYFGSSTSGRLKAVFFNLEPGMYSVKVAAQDGSVLAVDSIAVDFWTTGVVQTGGTMEFDTTTSEMAAE